MNICVTTAGALEKNRISGASYELCKCAEDNQLLPVFFIHDAPALFFITNNKKLAEGNKNNIYYYVDIPDDNKTKWIIRENTAPSELIKIESSDGDVASFTQNYELSPNTAPFRCGSSTKRVVITHTPAELKKTSAKQYESRKEYVAASKAQFANWLKVFSDDPKLYLSKKLKPFAKDHVLNSSELLNIFPVVTFGFFSLILLFTWLITPLLLVCNYCFSTGQGVSFLFQNISSYVSKYLFSGWGAYASLCAQNTDFTPSVFGIVVSIAGGSLLIPLYVYIRTLIYFEHPEN